MRGAGEYYVLCRSFEDDIKISNQESYDKLAITWKKDILEFKKPSSIQERFEKIQP